MSRYSATIAVDAPDPGAINAIYESIRIDESFYPENPVETSVVMAEDGRLVVTSGSDNLAHLRANLNSTLRLIQACHASIAESVKGQGSKNIT